MRTVSGERFIADQAKAKILFPRTTCETEINVYVPRSEGFKGVLVGNDYQKKTGMVSGFAKPRPFFCALPQKEKPKVQEHFDIE